MGKAQNAGVKHKREDKIKKELHKDNQGFGQFCQKERHKISATRDGSERGRGKDRNGKNKED